MKRPTGEYITLENGSRAVRLDNPLPVGTVVLARIRKPTGRYRWNDHRIRVVAPNGGAEIIRYIPGDRIRFR